MDRLSFDPALARDLGRIPVQAHRDQVAASAILAVWRRRYLVLLAAVIALLIAIGVLAGLERGYIAEAVIQIDLRRQEAVPLGSQAGTVTLDPSVLVQSEARIIQSRAMARRVVETLGLAKEQSEPTTAQRLLTDTLDSARQVLGLPVMPRPQNPAALALDLATREVLSRLTVAADNRTYLITIGFKGREPEQAARVANAFADEYLKRRDQVTAGAAGKARDWITAQIRETRAALQAADKAVLSFRQQYGLLPSGGAGGDTETVQQQMLRSLTTQYNDASLNRTAEERRLARAQEILAARQIPASTDLQASPLIAVLAERQVNAQRELEELSSQFGSRHPSVLRAQAGLADLRQRLDVELRRAMAVLRGNVVTARQMEEELRNKVEALQRTLLDSKAQEGEFRNLQLAVQTSRERLAVLVQSSDQAAAAQNLAPTIASLIMPAEPVQLPASPKPVVVLMLGLAGGLLSGVLAALLLERRDHGFRTAAEVMASADKRCLGMVPELPRGDIARGGASNSARRAMFEEAVKGIGASIGLFSKGHEGRVVLVTSALPGEGKSTLCKALADVLVQSGLRVLLLDGTSGGFRAAPLQLADDMAPPDRPALLVVREGRSLSSGQDTNGRGNLEAFIGDARKRFDVILLEGGPVMLVADSLVLGQLADTVVQVVRWGRTRQGVVIGALRRLKESSVLVDGIVLNKVNLRQHAKLRVTDDCSFYRKERRFYESLSRSGGRAHPQTSTQV